LQQSIYSVMIYSIIWTMLVFTSSCLQEGNVFFTLFVLICSQWCPTHIMLCFCFVCFRLVHPMLPVHFWLALRYSLPFITNHWTFKMNNTTGSSSGTGTAGPSSTPEFTLDFRWRSCGLISSFLNSALWASFCSLFFGYSIFCHIYVC
jgi:hypothetical protein